MPLGRDRTLKGGSTDERRDLLRWGGGWPLSSSLGCWSCRSCLGDDDDAAAGFEGYIQSGTCAQPSDDFVADLESEDDAYDVEPYVAVGDDGEPVTLGYYGAPGVPGFGLAAIYTDQQFSMVITDPGTDEAVACGDILRPDADEFGEAGLAVVQLLPVGSSDVEGVAAIQRTALQRELDITPTQVRIILSTDPVSVPDEVAAGYEGYVQGGQLRVSGRRDPGRAEERGRRTT